MIPSAAAGNRPTAWWSRSGLLLDVLIGTAVVVAMAGPVLFAQWRLQAEARNGMWLGSVMARSISHGLPPTFFLNTNTGNASGIFNPLFAFYGSPLFAVFGALIKVFGDNVPVAFGVLMVLAFAAAYGGSAWISQQCGLRGRLVHVPAIVVVSAPYFLTDLYGRGDISEFVALSMIPLVIASVVHLVRADSWTSAPMAVLVVSVIVFTGSHNITLLWATLIAIVSLLVLAVVLRPKLPVKRLLQVAGLIVLSTMVNAWFLLPDVAFARSTTAGAVPVGILYTFFDSFGLLFNLGRAVPSQASSSAPALFVQAPVWFLLWTFACGTYIWCKRSVAFLREAWTVMAVLFVGVVGLILDTPLWNRLPATLRQIQFPYRLNGEVVLLAGGLVLVSLLAVQHELDGTRRSKVVAALVVSLLVVAAISVGLAVWQEWVPHQCPTAASDSPPPHCVADRSAWLTPPQVLPITWVAGNFYADTSEPVIPVSPDRVFVFSPDEVDAHGDRLEATIVPPAGTEPFITNIMGGPQLVSLSGGIERVGRTEAGYAIAQRVEPGNGPVQVDIRTADSPAIRIGRWLSLLSAIGVAVLLLQPLLSRRRGRRDRTARLFRISELN